MKELVQFVDETCSLLNKAASEVSSMRKELAKVQAASEKLKEETNARLDKLSSLVSQFEKRKGAAEAPSAKKAPILKESSEAVAEGDSWGQLEDRAVGYGKLRRSDEVFYRRRGLIN